MPPPASLDGIPAQPSREGGDPPMTVVSWTAMGKPPGHDDETRAPADPSVAVGGDDPDRAAILARRQRFIALALSGLATTAACEKPKEDPAAPKADKGTPQGKGDDGAPPQACLKVAPPEPEGEGSTGRPMPCLDVAPPEPEPDDVPPQACLKIAAPPPEPTPHPCLSIKPPPPEPKPQPCLKVRRPDPEPEPPKPQPCLRVADPKGA